jgi:transposase
LEKETLGELHKANTVPYRTRNRAQMLKLNAQGINVPEIAQIFNCHEHTVRATIKRWSKLGLVGLWEAKGRGALKD